jgi:hypothetical protein
MKYNVPEQERLCNATQGGDSLWPEILRFVQDDDSLYVILSVSEESALPSRSSATAKMSCCSTQPLLDSVADAVAL